MTILKYQVARRVVQILVIALMLLIPVVARYTNYLSARELDRKLEKWDGTLQGETLGIVDGVLRFLPGGEKQRVDRVVRDRKMTLSRVQSLRGGPWSVQIGDLSMTDPLAGAESIVASRSVMWVLAFSLVVPLLATLILGRVFCSWVPARVERKAACSAQVSRDKIAQPELLAGYEVRPARCGSRSGRSYVGSSPQLYLSSRDPGTRSARSRVRSF